MITHRKKFRALYRTALVAQLGLVSLLLCGCAATSAFMADTLPVWAGGLPADAPPRPSDPRYPEYERAMRAKAVTAGGESGKPPAA